MQTELLTFASWTLRVHIPDTPGPHPVLLLLHGWTGDENVMWVFARHHSPQTLIIAPRAPYPTPRGGFGWQPALTGSWPTAADLMPAVTALDALLDDLAAQPRFSAGRYQDIDVIGFSQGAAVSALFAACGAHRVRALALLAGFVPDALPPCDGALPQMPVFAAHGRQDDLVPVSRARQGVALLRQRGANLTYWEDDTGHKLSAAGSRALAAFWQANRPPSP
ncbi:MAG: alpha/beta fold hydrolase [Anaerolineales bacterium]